jgi:hypothetical protein
VAWHKLNCVHRHGVLTTTHLQERKKSQFHGDVFDKLIKMINLIKSLTLRACLFSILKNVAK